MPAAATTYAIPPEWRKRWALRKYGFHGLSHAYATRRAAELVGRPAGAAADRDLPSRRGRVAGRDPRWSLGRHDDGIHAARRAGHGDPLGQHRPGTRPVARGARRGCRRPSSRPRSSTARACSGLAGTADMRAILAAEAAGDEAAALAIGVYLHRLRASIAAMVAALGGLDVLVFTGGVGENAPAIRGASRRRPRLPRRRRRSRGERTRRAGTWRSAPPAHRCAPSSFAPARTSRSHARSGRCWA